MNVETEAVPTLKLGDMPAVSPKVRERLRGRAIAGGWLAVGLDPDLDAARERHHELLRVTARAADALRTERQSWQEHDREHAEQLREAIRSGTSEPADERPSADERRAAEGRLTERLQASLAVLAEHVELAIKLVRAAENRILAGLRGQAEAAREKRRQAEELLAEARREEWKLAQLATWTMRTADDGGFGQQPAPTGNDGPPGAFRGLEDRHLGRHWTAERKGAVA